MEILENAVSCILNGVITTIVAISGLLGISVYSLGVVVVILATAAILVRDFRKHPRPTEKDILRRLVVLAVGAGVALVLLLLYVGSLYLPLIPRI